MKEDKNIHKPLEFPKKWLNMSWWDRHISMGLPLIGIDKKVWRKIKRQLSERDASILQAWHGNERFLKIRDIVCGLVEKYFGWQNSFFLPEDPCEIVFFCPFYGYDDLIETEFIIVLEEKFGIQWDKIFPLKFPPQMSFGEFIEKIELNTRDRSN